MKSASKMFKALFGALVFLLGVTAFPAHAQPLINLYPYEGSYEPLAAYGVTADKSGYKVSSGTGYYWEAMAAAYVSDGIEPMADSAAKASAFGFSTGGYDLAQATIAWYYAVTWKDGTPLDPLDPATPASIPLKVDYIMHLDRVYAGGEAVAEARGHVAVFRSEYVAESVYKEAVSSNCRAVGTQTTTTCRTDPPVGTLSFDVPSSHLASMGKIRMLVGAYTTAYVIGYLLGGQYGNIYSSAGAHTFVKAYIYIDPAWPRADELQLLTRESVDSPNYIPPVRTPLSGISVAWGNNGDGELGDGSFNSSTVPVPVNRFGDLVAISASADHNLALRSDGTVLAWGDNFFGQLGDGTTTDRPTPVQVIDPADPTGFLRGVSAIAAGAGFSLALKADCTVWAWGSNAIGKLGDGTTTNRLTPVQAVDPGDPTGKLTNIVAIAAGSWYAHVVKGDGTVWRLSQAPIQIDDPSDPTGHLTGVVAVAAGADHDLALKADGTVRAWGSNVSGQLGDGTGGPGVFSDTPVKVVDPGDPTGFLTDVVAVAAANRADMFTMGLHSLALKRDGTVWAWGNNSDGQLGDGCDLSKGCLPQLSPVQVVDPQDSTGHLTNVIAIAAGSSHSLALKRDGTVRAWGSGFNGQLGNGRSGRPTPRFADSSVPVPVIDPGDPTGQLANVVAAAAGARHSLAMLSTQPGASTAAIGSAGGRVDTGMVPPADTLGGTVVVPPGALTSLTTIAIAELDPNDPSLPPPPSNSLSRVFRFTPAGLGFGSPVTILFRYNEAEVAGKDESQLQVNVLLDSTYVTLPACIDPAVPNPDPCVSGRDPNANTITAKTTHFSVYALGVGPANNPPVAKCKNITVSAGPTCQATASTNDGSFDPDGDPITLSQSPLGPHPLGNTLVTLTVTDDKGLSSQCMGTVTVVDTTPPTVSCPTGRTVAAGANCKAAIPNVLTDVVASDNCTPAASLTKTQSPAAGTLVGLGTHTITVTVTDQAGNSTNCTTTLTVVDTTPPKITGVSANPSVLWPPNHKMVPVTVAVSASDNCGGSPTCSIVSVMSNEPINGLGDGDTAPDWDITGALTVNLRAERSGKGSGRVYTITVQCTDASGNSATKTAAVTVPHDQRKK